MNIMTLVVSSSGSGSPCPTDGGPPCRKGKGKGTAVRDETDQHCASRPDEQHVQLTRVEPSGQPVSH